MKIGIRTLHSAIKGMFSKKIVMLRKKNISSYEKKGLLLLMPMKIVHNA